MHSATRILRNENRSMACVLQGLQQLAHLARNRSMRPDFTVLRALIYYIDTFPGRLHHPKEEACLFPRLHARSPESAKLLEKLRADHERGAMLLRDLEASVTAFEAAWPAGSPQFAAAARKYADFQWDHIRREEQVLLPLAEAMLTAEDWNAVDEALAANQDPLHDLEHKNVDGLFARIVTIAPMPVGTAAIRERIAA